MASLVGKNITYLSLSQAANYLLPLITIPYISRVIGEERFGLVEFATTTALYFISVIEYSFDLSGTREMARKRDRPEEVQELFNGIFFAKIFLFILATLVFVPLVLFVPSLREHAWLFVFAYLTSFSFVFSQNWFFQGLEKLGIVAVANMGIKLIFTILIFGIIHVPEDYLYIPLSSGIGYIIVSIWTLFYALRIYPSLKIRYPGKDVVIDSLKKGWHLFSTSIMNKIYALNGMIIAGYFLTSASLGYYGAAHKLFLVVQSMMFVPVQMAVLPHLSNKLEIGLKDYLEQFKKISFILLAVFSLGLVILWIISPWVVAILFGAQFSETAPIFQWFIPSLFASLGLNLFLYQGLLALNEDKLFFRIVLVFAVISLVGNYLSMKFGGAIQAAQFRSGMDLVFALIAAILFKIAINRKVHA